MNCLTKLPTIFLLINLRQDQEKWQHVRRFVNTITKLEITQLLIPHQDRCGSRSWCTMKKITTTKEMKKQTGCNSQLCFALCSKYLVLTACENAHFECFIVLMADKKNL